LVSGPVNQIIMGKRLYSKSTIRIVYVCAIYCVLNGQTERIQFVLFMLLCFSRKFHTLLCDTCDSCIPFHSNLFQINWSSSPWNRKEGGVFASHRDTFILTALSLSNSDTHVWWYSNQQLKVSKIQSVVWGWRFGLLEAIIICGSKHTQDLTQFMIALTIKIWLTCRWFR